MVVALLRIAVPRSRLAKALTQKLESRLMELMGKKGVKLGSLKSLT